MTTDVHELASKIDKLLEKTDGKDVHIFTSEEVNDLQRVLQFVRRMDALGFWGRWVFYFVVSTGAILVNWERVTGWLRGE